MEHRSATGFQPLDLEGKPATFPSPDASDREELSAYARIKRHKRGREVAFPLGKRVLKVAERDEWTCHLCRKKIDSKMLVGDGRATLDHLLPRSLGGTSCLSNLKIAHKGCNTKRGNRPLPSR
jgi:5-methylcytosine-specific restriction endonuclease McrA